MAAPREEFAPDHYAETLSARDFAAAPISSCQQVTAAQHEAQKLLVLSRDQLEQLVDARVQEALVRSGFFSRFRRSAAAPSLQLRRALLALRLVGLLLTALAFWHLPLFSLSNVLGGPLSSSLLPGAARWSPPLGEALLPAACLHLAPDSHHDISLCVGGGGRVPLSGAPAAELLQQVRALHELSRASERSVASLLLWTAVAHAAACLHPAAGFVALSYDMSLRVALAAAAASHGAALPSWLPFGGDASSSSSGSSGVNSAGLLACLGASLVHCALTLLRWWPRDSGGAGRRKSARLPAAAAAVSRPRERPEESGRGHVLPFR